MVKIKDEQRKTCNDREEGKNQSTFIQLMREYKKGTFSRKKALSSRSQRESVVTKHQTCGLNGFGTEHVTRRRFSVQKLTI
jgi:hypothetical protein